MISDFKKLFKSIKIVKSKTRKKRYYDNTSVINMHTPNTSKATIINGVLVFEMELLYLQDVMQTPINGVDRDV